MHFQIVVRAKKQPWASPLCHSLVPHTDVDLCLCFVEKVSPALRQSRRFKTGPELKRAICLSRRGFPGIPFKL